MFFKRFLGISDVKARFQKDQLGFLKEIIKTYLIRFPFQNITSFGQFKPLDRANPGLKEMIKANLTGGGGLCGHNNVFLKYQLECIGYETMQIPGCFVRTGIPDSHNLFTIRIPERLSKENPRKTKTYLVDAGCGVPLHEPICLEELPYRGRAGGLNFRYEWVDQTTIQRVNESGDAIIGKKREDFKSPQDYTITLRSVNMNDAKGPIAAVYENVRSVFLHQGLYCFRYLDIREDDFEIICIRGTELVFITKETRKTETFANYGELLPVVLKYFPMIDPTEVKLSIENFSLPFEDAIKLSKNAKRERA